MLSLSQLKYGLALTLQYVQASEGLLELAAAREPNALISQYFEHHLAEERNHAKWLEEDLDGYTLPPQPLTAAMAGTMYYLVEHVSPMCLLGYMLVLEHAASIEEVEKLEAAYGKKLLRTARIHAEQDPSHEQDLISIIQGLPEGDKAWVAMASDWTQRYLSQIQAQVQGAFA